MWIEQVLQLHLHFLQNYAPLQISVYKSHPLYNSETLWGTFLKLGTNRRCTEIKYHNSIYSIYRIMPFVNYNHPSVDPTVCNSKNPMRFFDKTLYKYIALSDDANRTNTITPPTYRIMPLSKFQYMHPLNYRETFDIWSRIQCQGILVTSQIISNYWILECFKIKIHHSLKRYLLWEIISNICLNFVLWSIKKGDFITKMMDTNFQKIRGTWKNLIFGILEPALLYIQRQVECKDGYSVWWLQQCSFL